MPDLSLRLSDVAGAVFSQRHLVASPLQVGNLHAINLSWQDSDDFHV
jgi:hypothetical protein